jgi:hypothetical protein
MATQTRTGFALVTDGLGPLHWFGIALAAVTGAIHLFLGAAGLLSDGPIGTGLAVSFLLAGLGFFGAVALLLVDYRRRLLYAVGVPYTAVQILLWYVINRPASLGDVGTLGLVDKTVQVVLVVVLVALYRRES